MNRALLINDKDEVKIDVGHLFCLDCGRKLVQEEIDADRGQCFDCYCVEQSA